MSDFWINNKLTDMTKEEAVLKLIDVHAFLCRYSNPHDKWTDAVNIGIEAIKALEQESATKNDLGVDCISRQSVANYIDYIQNHGMGKKKSFDFISKFVAKLPSVTPQEPRWIPVSERLPKIAGVYRVTRYYPKNVMNPNYLVDACCFDGSNTWYDDNRINLERGHVDNIIAWQENPEPYKAESEG